jgi:hypothetical protein
MKKEAVRSTRLQDGNARRFRTVSFGKCTQGTARHRRGVGTGVSCSTQLEGETVKCGAVVEFIQSLHNDPSVFLNNGPGNSLPHSIFEPTAHNAFR